MKIKLLFVVAPLLCSLAVLAQSNGADLPKLNHFDPAAADRSLNPCDDFYKFVCSKWMKANPIPPDQSTWSVESNLSLWNDTVLRDTMIAASKPDPKRTPIEQKIGDYWQSCMDESAIETTGLTAIKPDLDRVNAMKTKAELASVLARLHASVPGAWAGNDNATPAALFGVGPSQDFADATLVVTSMDQGGMGLPGRDYYIGDNPKLVEARKKYQDHVAKMFVLAGEPAQRASADAVIVMHIETELAKSAMDAVKRRDPKNIYNVMSIEQVKALTPSFRWDEYLKAIDAQPTKHYIVSAPDFFRALEPLIKSESLDNWKTYLRWWTLHGNAQYLNKAIVDENFSFYGRTLTGAPEMRPRWRRCVRFADRDLGEALGQAYVDRAFPPDNKARVSDLVNEIEKSLAGDIDKVEWMNPDTKKQAHAKLDGIEDKIGYPKVWRDYSAVNVVRNNMAANVHQATAFEFRRQLQKVGRPVDRGEWIMTPATIDAYYDPQLNTINFPAGILQPPLFDVKDDEAVNYGALGSVIGHEITHGFDDEGRKFDAKGNLRDWWTAEDAKNYEERGKCIADQYTQDIPEVGVKQNGQLTQGEDTADNGGVRLAFMALQDALQKAGRSLDEKDGDGWTPRQKFFLGYAFDWCSNVRPEIARTQVVTNPHSLPRYRVNNVVSDVPEFWEAFGCKAGQSMRRENACRVW